MGGYTNRLLEFDLTANAVKICTPEEELYGKYLGGRGFGARLLYDLLPAGVDPLSGENILLILAGPFTGTLVPGAGKYVVITKSPVSKGFVDAYASGRIAVELKFAGYDGLILRGKAAQPSYLYIQDDKVEIRDAAFLWGKDTFETEDLLREALGDHEVGICCIGPAGERLVKFATINSDYYRQAGRGGVGAVMGAKNIKAVVVKGSRGVKSHDHLKLLSLVQDSIAKIPDSPVAKARIQYGTPLTLNITNAAGMLPTSNFRKGQFAAAEKINAEACQASTIKSRACYGCSVGCGKIMEAKEGKYKGSIVEGPEYETLGLLGSNLEIDELPAVIQANILCDRLGVDTISTGCVLGFVMECMEREYLKPEDVNGLEMQFGSAEPALRLIHDIAYRQGAGDWLAEGVRAAAGKIGNNSIDFAMQVKGLEFPAYDPRIGYGTALAYAVNPRGACHRRAWPPAVEVLGKEKPCETEGKAGTVKRLYDENSILHSLLVCDMPAKFIPLKPADYAGYYEAVTGKPMTVEELMTIADRVETMIRLFNNREGFSRADDTLPPRAFNEGLLNGPAQGRFIPREALNLIMTEFYALRGWDERGIPSAETLTRLQVSRERGNPLCDCQ
jgi:aldehyde:ferredoxin oxidoreductase